MFVLWLADDEIALHQDDHDNCGDKNNVVNAAGKKMPLSNVVKMFDGITEGPELPAFIKEQDTLSVYIITLYSQFI